MIIGLGSDLCDVRRIAKTIERHGERFLNRIFTPAERAKANRRANVAETYFQMGQRDLALGNAQAALARAASKPRAFPADPAKARLEAVVARLQATAGPQSVAPGAAPAAPAVPAARAAAKR